MFLIWPSTYAQVPRDTAEIIEGGQIASEAVAESWNQLWESVLQGGLYFALARVGILFAVATLLLFLTQWTRQMVEGESSRAYTDFIWPLLVIVLLSNNGSRLAAFTLTLRDYINQINQEVLTYTAADIRLQEAYQIAVLEDSVEQTIVQRRNQCYELQNPEERANCIQLAAAEAQTFIEDYRARTGNPNALSRALEEAQAGENAIESGLRFSGALIGSGFQTATRGILMALHIAFQWLIEASMLLTATLGPMAVGGSLLPVGAKPIMAWLTGFFSIAVAKLSFNILSGLVSLAVLNAENSHPLIAPFFLGLLAPILSLALASGGGMAVFGSLTGAVGVIAGAGAMGGVARSPRYSRHRRAYRR
ncbi:MAG: hypothetical protein AAGF01_00160 [Cyanobacteria bacterium P01_G01_bin.38]